MRISDWSSDVCSSDLEELRFRSDINGVAEASGLHIGFSALGGRARIASVKFASAGFDNIADEDQHRRCAERIDIDGVQIGLQDHVGRSEEHTSELQSLMRISYAVFCLKKKNT